MSKRPPSTTTDPIQRAILQWLHKQSDDPEHQAVILHHIITQTSAGALRLSDLLAIPDMKSLARHVVVTPEKIRELARFMLKAYYPPLPSNYEPLAEALPALTITSLGPEHLVERIRAWLIGYALPENRLDFLQEMIARTSHTGTLLVNELKFSHRVDGYTSQDIATACRELYLELKAATPSEDDLPAETTEDEVDAEYPPLYALEGALMAWARTFPRSRRVELFEELNTQRHSHRLFFAAVMSTPAPRRRADIYRAIANVLEQLRSEQAAIAAAARSPEPGTGNTFISSGMHARTLHYVRKALRDVQLARAKTPGSEELEDAENDLTTALEALSVV